MNILMCKPTFFDVDYQINPWMRQERPVNKARAQSQWQSLYQTIQQLGGKIDLIEPQQGLPDMVFTANAGLIHRKKVIVANFKHPERQGESQYFKNWFAQNHFQVFETDIPFEGAGDALFAGETLFVGHGFRSHHRIVHWIEEQWERPVTALELVNPSFYHLDTCFCPLNSTNALWYPAAFSKKSQKLLENELNLLSVSQKEAELFACNAVVINRDVILPKDCTKIITLLENQGFSTHSISTTEFILSGGSCKCLTLHTS